jgi:hypothetical protein
VPPSPAKTVPVFCIALKFVGYTMQKTFLYSYYGFCWKKNYLPRESEVASIQKADCRVFWRTKKGGFVTKSIFE